VANGPNIFQMLLVIIITKRQARKLEVKQNNDHGVLLADSIIIKITILHIVQHKKNYKKVQVTLLESEKIDKIRALPGRQKVATCLSH